MIQLEVSIILRGPSPTATISENTVNEMILETKTEPSRSWVLQVLTEQVQSSYYRTAENEGRSP